jgi:surfeit locus 1 family protein
MHMRRSRALILLAAIGLAALTARLGAWQLDRASQKLAVQASLDERRSLPILAVRDLAHTLEGAAAQHHRQIELEGRWLPAHTVYLDNRPMDGRVGFIVLTPLQLADGSAVIVQRGWLPRDASDRTRIAPYATPAGLVRLVGRIAPAPGRLYEFDAVASGPIRQNMDLSTFARETRLALRPLSVQQLPQVDIAEDGLRRHWPSISADVHKHYGYAFQWFALSALTIALYVWFQLIRPHRRAARES